MLVLISFSCVVTVILFCELPYASKQRNNLIFVLQFA